MQRIGSVGESAVLELADEPHLHFEVLKSGISVDPMAHLSDESIETWLGGSDAVED
jgi:murein DD-endopeptidase MepM/ murein hydrolase activator NlpD